MNISDIIEAIHSLNSKHLDQTYGAEYLPVDIVVTSDGETSVTGFEEIASWRGVYAEPCLITGSNHSSFDLLKELYMTQSGSGYTGWKGGYFSYDGSYELNVESCHSAYTGEGYIYNVDYDESDGRIKIHCDKG